MDKKHVIRSGIFILILFISGTYLLDVFNWKDATDDGIDIIGDFYKTPDDTIDVIFYGSSHCFCTINNAILWDEYSIASYNLAAGCQNLGNTYYHMVESLKTQSPKVMAVEMLYSANDGYTKTGDVYRNTLRMKWSKGYYDNVVYAVNKSSCGDSKWDLLLKVPIIHSRYKELKKRDFNTIDTFSRGYRSSWEVTPFERPRACQVSDIGKLSDETIYWLDKMVALAKENDIQLVFWVAPFILTEEQAAVFNAVGGYSRQNDIDFIDFNKLYEEIRFDSGKDMWESSHVNVYGAQKVTRYFGAYLHNNHVFEADRSDDRYRAWEQELKAWSLKVNDHGLWEKESFPKYLRSVYQAGYVCVMKVSDGDVDISTATDGLIASSDLYEGTAVVVDGQMIDHAIDALDIDCYTTVGIRGGSCFLDGIEYVFKGKLSLWVYDRYNKAVVEMVFCDDLDTLEVLR